MQVVQRFLFKMFDIYLAVYLELRRNQDPEKKDDSLMSHERNIERASHWLTIDAIKTNYETYELTFPIWFKKSPAPEDGGGGGDPGQPFAAVVDKVNEVKKDVEKKVDEVRKTSTTLPAPIQEPEETPGTAQMKAVFAILKGSQKKDSAAPPGPPTAADATNQKRSTRS